MNEAMRILDRADAGVNVAVLDRPLWKVRARAELFFKKHWKNADGSTNRPDFFTESTGNILVRGGASLLWECLRGAGSTATSNAKKYFNATAALAVGNSSAAATNTQLDLQGGSKIYKAMTGGFPTHTTGSTAATVADIVYKSTYGLTEGNFAWNEWGLFNKTTSTNRRMLNRKVQALLTKTSAASATLTVTLTLA